MAKYIISESQLNILKEYENSLKEKEDDDPCWKGYKQYGMKTKNGKEVPNCVKENIDLIGEEEINKLDECSYIKENYINEYNCIESINEDEVTLKEGLEPVDIYKHKLQEIILGESIIVEAEYKGKKVELNKPMRGDVKKYKVFVNSGKKTKDGKIKVKKVNFGDKNMEIKRDDLKRRKSFRARHKCDQAKDKTKAKYWSCKFWSGKKVSDLLKK